MLVVPHADEVTCVRPAPAAERACQHGCGWTAFGTHATCCTRCCGPDGPHADDCPQKNRRVQRTSGAPRPSPQAVPTSARPPTHTGLVMAAPPVRRLQRPSGRRRAVLIGINYKGTKAKLNGCVNDVANMESLLVETFGWDRRSIRMLTDKNKGAMPTRTNIEAALSWLTQDVLPGDVLFFHFSGHGSQKPDPKGYEEDGMNETILPVDFRTAGVITDDQLSEMIVRPLPDGAKLTAVMDCCHSGTGMDLPFVWNHRGWREETNPFYSPADVQLFSGCEADQKSADTKSFSGEAGGAMTKAFCSALRKNPSPSYPQLMRKMQNQLAKRGLRQCPALSSTQSFDLNRPFHLDHILPNQNPQFGRIIRKRFAPGSKPRPVRGPIAELLGLALVLAA